MAMKPSLQLKIGTQLTMTPQLQQAIALLQLSTLDLRQEIQQALDGNPLLEQEEGFGEISVSEPTEDSWNNEIPDQLYVDSDWSDTYQDTNYYSNAQAPDFERDGHVQGLKEQLSWQLTLQQDVTVQEQQIAESLIDSVNSDGYLAQPLEDICAGLRNQGLNTLNIKDIEAVLKRLQQFEPTGVMARSLSECLTLQLNALPASTPWRAQASRLARQFLDVLACGNHKLLMRRLSLNEQQLNETIALLRSLDPRPGSLFDTDSDAYIIPDLLMRKVTHGWSIELNPDAIPRLRIQSDYAALIRRADHSPDNQFLKQHLSDAQWLIKSLHSRNDTLLKVGQAIMHYQQDFLDQGEAAMKPLILANIAEQVGMHESTISRVTTQKFIHTPRGVFELKHFFSSQVGEGANTHSSTAIRARIRKFINDEPSHKPLSDSRLVEMLAEADIHIARRTVAKYRESMNLASASQRKRMR
ncbi:RNA polymerase factor sigma-54 [Halomonas halocynthiae]|uniref:RNA polymerase factor sigma-54 n=1 Tax=Halomonas halocynthiae TaxID=176290 RepID=UPI00042841FB|nr:RNA polymerase factor sigma-54 [Halomonas halocynthiae]